MSKFISVNLESRGLINLPRTEIYAGEIHSDNAFEQEQADKILDKFTKNERNLLRRFNLTQIYNQSVNIKHKLYRYAKSPVWQIQNSMNCSQPSLIKDNTNRIIIQRKFHQPIHKKLNHIQDIIETEYFKAKVKTMNQSTIERTNKQANIKKISAVVKKKNKIIERVHTEVIPFTETHKNRGEYRSLSSLRKSRQKFL